MKLEIGFGNLPQQVSIPDWVVAGVLRPNKEAELPSPEGELIRALDAPIASMPLEQLAKGKKEVVIITSDITRPMPSSQVLPLVLDRLYAAGVDRKEITIVLALGSHRRHTDAERRKLLGEKIFGEISCVDSGDGGFIHMGTTSRGTPVDIASEVEKADFRICLGNIEYHYFAGYSGGVKAIMPGVSTREAIQFNHSCMVDPQAMAGKLEGNPLREDIEEAGEICPVDFILNVVLDEHKQIVYACAGHPVKAHRAGCDFLDRFYRKEISERCDIVIASQGGAPKDLNLYQTQKALDNAKHAVKDGGIIILVGSCKEGFGEEVFEEWMRCANTPQELIQRIRRNFQLGGHKAAAIAMVLEHAEIYLVSELAPELVHSIFMTPFSTVQSALDVALNKMGENAKVLVMPCGGSTLPVVQ